MALNNWMAQIDDNSLLREICMPGSHDACMYEVSPGNEKKIDDVVTQFLPIREQLDLGTRFFDIRLYLEDSKTLRPGHFVDKEKSDSFGSYGPLFSTVVADLHAFMTANPSEVVILKFSTSKHANKTAIPEIDDGALRNFLFTSASSKNLAAEKLGSLRGKILALFEDKESKSGRLHLADKKPPSAGKEKLGVAGDPSVLWLNGDAPRANRIKDVVEKQLKAEKSSSGGLTDHLTMRYLTITASKGDAFKNNMSVIDNTSREFQLTPLQRPQMHPQRSIYGSWAHGENAKNNYWSHAVSELVRQNKNVNIFMYDFINKEVNEMLISRNFDR